MQGTEIEHRMSHSILPWFCYQDYFSIISWNTSCSKDLTQVPPSVPVMSSGAVQLLHPWLELDQAVSVGCSSDRWFAASNTTLGPASRVTQSLVIGVFLTSLSKDLLQTLGCLATLLPWKSLNPSIAPCHICQLHLDSLCRLDI